MTAKLLFVAFTVNSVISQLVLRRGLQELVSPASLRESAPFHRQCRALSLDLRIHHAADSELRDVDDHCFSRETWRRHSDSRRGLLHLDGPIGVAGLWRNPLARAMGGYRARHPRGGLYQPGRHTRLKAIRPIAQSIDRRQRSSNWSRPKGSKKRPILALSGAIENRSCSRAVSMDPFGNQAFAHIDKSAWAAREAKPRHPVQISAKTTWETKIRNF